MKKKLKRKVNNGNKDGLESVVLKLPKDAIGKDEYGRYIMMCNYSWHIGIVMDEEVCNNRKCKYRKKFYLENDNK
ncbi:MAG: hypothetical protein ACOCRX_04110 [Candidatus Woesearchaeota archaeon]